MTASMIVKKTRAGVRLVNNTWHTLNSNDTVFVFIHGFFSDSDACWTSKSGVRWPDLVASDDRFAGPSIFMAGYYTAIDSGAYKISDCAREVFEALQRPGIDSEPAPMSKSRIVFVCHSLGGIVARYMIERNKERFAEKAVALLLIASPSYGAELASSLRGIIQLYQNKLAQQLTAANESLEDLEDRFKDLLANRKIRIFFGAEAVEHHFPLRWKFLPALKPIVSKSSASRYFGAGKLLQGTTHATCVKPTTHEHVSHKFLVTSVLEFFDLAERKSTPIQISDVTIPSRESTGTSQQSPPALFEVYTSACEPYYVVRDPNKEVSTTLEVFSVWVYGPSGLGKTAAIRREVADKYTNPIHVYIGSTGDTGGGYLTLLKEVYFTLVAKVNCGYKDVKTANQTLSEIAALLMQTSVGGKICLVIDEVPMISKDPLEMGNFVAALHGLITLLRQSPAVVDVRIVVTSIFDPQTFLGPGCQRIFEQIRFLEFKRWTQSDLSRLVTIILSDIQDFAISAVETHEILIAAQGSPRFVKTFFKNYLVTRISTEASVNGVIRETAVILGAGTEELATMKATPT